MRTADCGKSSNRILFGYLDKGFSPHESDHLQLSPAGTADLSPGRSPGLESTIKQVPQGTIETYPWHILGYAERAEILDRGVSRHTQNTCRPSRGTPFPLHPT
jgi:hypothetical protein